MNNNTESTKSSSIGHQAARAKSYAHHLKHIEVAIHVFVDIVVVFVVLFAKERSVVLGYEVLDTMPGLLRATAG